MVATNQSVLRLLWMRFAWRHWRRSPVSSILLLLILAIGVAAFFSIRLANRAAVASFQNFTDLVTSQSDGLITAPVGTLSETVLPELRQMFGNQPVNLVPVLETTAVAPSPTPSGDRKHHCGRRNARSDPRQTTPAGQISLPEPPRIRAPCGVTQTSGLLCRRLPVCMPSDQTPRRKRNRNA